MGPRERSGASIHGISACRQLSGARSGARRVEKERDDNEKRADPKIDPSGWCEVEGSALAVLAAIPAIVQAVHETGAGAA
jgi:hypothetical protein